MCPLEGNLSDKAGAGTKGADNAPLARPAEAPFDVLNRRSLWLRPANPGDLPALACLEQASFSLPRSYDMLAVELDDERTTFLVAEIRSRGQLPEVIGYLSWLVVLDEVQVGNICVAPEHRGKGAGDALLKEMIARTDCGLHKKILLEVRAGNRPAIALYQKNGFVEAGRRKNYYFKPVEDAILMDYYF